MKIRFAESADERAQVFRQRYRVYSQEMHLYGEVADHERKSLSDADDAGARILAAFDEAGVVGSLRVHGGIDGPLPARLATRFHVNRFEPLIPPVRMAAITRFTLDPEHRGSRLAFSLIIELARHLLDLGVQLAFLDCAPHLINLYSALGFRPYAANIDDPQQGVLVPLVFVTGDLGFLRRIRSPLAKIFAEHPSLPELPMGLAGLLGSDPPVASECVADSGYWSVVADLPTSTQRDPLGILSGLGPEERERLLTSGHLLESRRGDTIIKKGTVSRSMFVVLDGTVSVRDGERILALRGVGSVLGEIAFLAETPRTADVRAETDVRTLNLDERAVHQFIERDGTGAATLLLNLTRMLCLKLAERPSSAEVGASADAGASPLDHP